MGFQALYRRPEHDILLPLIERARFSPEARFRVAANARALIEAMRSSHRPGGIGQFLHEYRLSSAEGVVLLSLAEAFLRIPDAATEDLLIRDKLASVDWRPHVGKSNSLLVNTSSLMLAVTGRLLSADEARGLMSRLVARLGEPVIRRAVRAAMHLMGDQFVMGRTIEKAIERSQRSEAEGFRHNFDMLGEGARTMEDARRYLAAYREAISAIGEKARGGTAAEAPGISVKLSALHPRYEPALRERVLEELVPVVIALGELARQEGIGMTIDAEEAERLELSLEMFERIAAAPSLAGWNGLGLAVQAYQKRALAVIEWIEELGTRTDRVIAMRLVKGAYWDTEIKRTQERGLDDYPVFTRKAATDVSYLACARAMLDAPHISPAFATHNALTVASILELVGSRRDFEFQRLHGMGEGLYEAVRARDATIACRTYAPVGSHEDLLAYLARRLLENGANSSFLYQIQDDQVPIEGLVTDPVEAVEAAGATPHPRIALPRNLFGSRRLNSSGVDLSDRATISTLDAELREHWSKPWTAGSLVDGAEGGRTPVQLVDPASRNRIVGEVRGATPEEVDRAVEIAARAQPGWNDTDPAERATRLRRAADLLETRCSQFMAIAIREAGKTIPDAVAEVREAVDFLRYYAACAESDFIPTSLPGVTGEENRIALSGRGVFACVSPWNFPLAIFTGQIAAALAAGNAVVAKPAPQTPVMGWTMVKLLHEAGIPTDVLHLIPGGGDIGQRLIGHANVGGVAFTGSTATARGIFRTLAGKDGPIVPLIAETGGQNAMIVDSSALPEQAVGDIVVSAFLSAGQRCSATRILFVQEDVSERVLGMLAGAMDQLHVGDPAELATDIGPVIDEPALRRLDAHLASVRSGIVHQLQAPSDGWFVGPSIVRIGSPADLKGEVFGPILHVVEWQAGALDKVVDAINATGFGLTLGVHSRIQESIDFIARRARVGNLYVNRSMVGAVVGSQPFGGEGLSGTGPKAGGPNYLRRFATERVVSINTSATGDVGLLSLSET